MNLLKHALAGSIGTYDFAIKAGLVFMALAFGLKGGEIMPTLAIGGLTGCSVGQLIGIDAAFAGALGVITFYVGMSRCPIAGFFLGCEVFGWGIAPFLTIGVICALVGNRDYGYYGHGFSPRRIGSLPLAMLQHPLAPRMMRLSSVHQKNSSVHAKKLSIF